jgi:hypothetical protein
MHAGLATAVITPPTPVHLAGYGDRHEPATVVHDDLETCVLIVETEATRACLVTCDLLALSRDFADVVRGAAADAAGTTTDLVLPSCTHVHAGPSTLTGTDAIGWPVPDGYRERLAARVADAATRARAALRPVDAAFARTDLPAGVATNRRGHPLTPTAAILVLDPVAVVANFGIHPTVTGPSNLAIATDWVGPFRRAVAARTGLPTVFLQGCQGDVNPATTAWDDGDPAAWAPVVAAYADGLATAVAGAAVPARPIALDTPVARVRTAEVAVGETLLAHLAGASRSRHVELIDWTLGELHIVAVPGEGFHGVEAVIRASHPDPLLVAGLAPEWHGYLPRPYTDGYEEGLSLGPDAVAEIVAALAV